jgi:5'-AMP-activated protein kinase catalytic alpha subunit
MDNNEDTPLKENKELEEEEEILSVPPEDMTDINDPEQKKKIMCDFIIKEVIGEGTFATVRLAINKQTGQKVAIKIMEKNKIVHQEDRVRIEREIKVLKNLRHPNIVHLYSVIKTEEKIYLIMEYVKGKELFDYIVMKKKLSESESCSFFQQIISGIEYLHKIKYVHRDIKPENLLINEETKELKIVDFGLSNIYTNPNKHLLSSACGSPSYAAPEMLNGEKYRAQPVDIWSCGIVLYAMICGYLPFEDEDNEALYDKICRGKFVIPNHVTENARDLINKILVTDPKKRLTIYQIKHHPWFSLYNDKGKLMISDGLVLSKIVEPIDEEVVSSMSKTFNLTEQKIRISIY